MGDDINASSRSNGEGRVIAIVDDFSKLKLFNYPANQPNAGYVKYAGHSSRVSNVMFDAANKHIITTGGDELSVF